MFASADGGAKLLDFSVPGLPEEAQLQTAQKTASPSSIPPLRNNRNLGPCFLAQLACTALEGRISVR